MTRKPEFHISNTKALTLTSYGVTRMRKPVLAICLMIFVSIAYAAPSQQTTFYVALDGSDRNPATTEHPLASLAGARGALR